MNFARAVAMRTLTRSDRNRQISGVIYSKLTVLLFISLLLVFIYPFFLVISGVDPTIPVEIQSENKIVNYLQMALPLLCIAVGLLYRGPDVFRLRLQSTILIYPFICLTSTIWSVDPYYTLRFASLMLLYLLAIAAVSQVLDIEVFCGIIVKVLMFLILASVVMAIAFPKYGTHQLVDSIEDNHAGQWRGVFTHKNHLGAAASIGVFVFLFFRQLVRVPLGFLVICAVAAMACLIFAQSAGAWLALCVLLVYYYLIRVLPVSGSILVLILVAVGALAFTTFSFFSDDLVGVVGRDMTFTGRTYIWRVVLDAIWQRPILGYGYFAATADFMRPLLIVQVGSPAVDAHNGYLDVLLGTGIVGLAILLFCISSVIARGIRRAKTSIGRESDCFLLLVTFPISSLFFSFFEVAGISGGQSVLGALTFLSLAAIPSYLRVDRGRYQSPAYSADTGSAARLSKN
jgi:exopolysaccharide production protein ExoQ